LLWPGKGLNTVDAPSGTLLLAEDGQSTFISSLSTNDGIMNMEGTPPPDYNTYSSRHSGGSNVLYVDSHVKWGSYDTLVAANLQTAGISPECPVDTIPNQ
jgi:prepilin-type processing-associated H-X9-DG protein